MSKSLQFVIPVCLLAMAIMVAGCASTGSADAADHAIMCPKCETVWVPESKSAALPRNVHRFAHKAEMTCPSCDKMAAAYFEDSKAVLHQCPDCKVTPKVLAPRQPISDAGQNRP